MSSRAKATATTDHDEIRRWTEERGAKPACVRNTGDSNDVGILDLEFPGYSGEQSLQPIDWDHWFEKFDERGLAFLRQETTASGQKSNFNRFVSRETVQAGNRASGGSVAEAGSSKTASKGKTASRNVRLSSEVKPAQKHKTVTNVSRKHEGAKPSPHTRPHGGRAA